jgi:hypothetical protein
MNARRPTSLRGALPLAALAAALLPVTPAAAASSPARDVAGPAGLRVLHPAAVSCPPGQVGVAIRFTRASARRGVRSVRVVALGTTKSITIAARSGKRRSAKLAVPCGKAVRVSYQARNARKRVIARRDFRISAAPATPQVPQGPVGPVGVPGSGQVPPGADPAAGGPPPGAHAPDAATGTQWTTFVDVRPSGTRAGQTCAYVDATNGPDKKAQAVRTFCGKLSEDPFFVRTTHAEDPADGSQRLVLTGVANPDRVASVSVTGPGGTQTLALSVPREGMPGTGGAFIAVFGGDVTVQELTLVVTLKDGTSQSHPSPAHINLRSSSGDRL